MPIEAGVRSTDDSEWPWWVQVTELSTLLTWLLSSPSCCSLKGQYIAKGLRQAVGKWGVRCEGNKLKYAGRLMVTED